MFCYWYFDGNIKKHCVEVWCEIVELRLIVTSHLLFTHSGIECVMRAIVQADARLISSNQGKNATKSMMIPLVKFLLKLKMHVSKKNWNCICQKS